MPSITNNPLAFISAGVEANRLAGQAAIIKGKREKISNKVQTRLDDHKNINTRNSVFKIVAFCAAIAWGIATVAEYFVSRGIYAVILSTEPSNLKPSLLAAALALFAVLLSAAWGEFIHPIFAKTEESYQGFPYLESILKWENKHIDSRLIWVVIGILSTLATAYFLFALSKQRVALEAIVNGFGENRESLVEILIPPVLFIIEVITGIFLPFTIYMIHFSISAKLLSIHHDMLTHQYENVANQAASHWTAYTLERHRYNNLNPKSQEDQLPMTKELRELLIGRFGQEAMTGHDGDSSGNGSDSAREDFPGTINSEGIIDNTRL